MVKIVNLSAIHTLRPIRSSLEEFARICDENSESSLCCCPGFFQHYSNFAWVAWQYKSHFKDLIQPYKLGKLTTEEFLANLKCIFPFLQAEDSDQQLIDAWNTIISLEGSFIDRFGYLAEEATSADPVYLISNTNELNVIKILTLLKEKNPEIKFHDPVELSVESSFEPIEIAPNIYLCLSYRYQLFKTVEQNNTKNNEISPYSTMSLLNYLVEKQLKSKDVDIISQYPNDLKEAQRIGISTDNLYSADDYFAASHQLKKVI
jgi:hypothetical protein